VKNKFKDHHHWDYEIICPAIGGSLSNQDGNIRKYSCGIIIYIYKQYKGIIRFDNGLCKSIIDYVGDKHPYLNIEFKYIGYAVAN